MLTHEHMTGLIRTYFAGCNEADTEKMSACFTPDAVHYFPPGMYRGPLVGADAIADFWVYAVRTFGSVWTVDQVITDPASGRAVIEWTHFKTLAGTVLRGDEWYLFDSGSGLITEIRAYYAAPQAPDLDRLELGGFDYAGRGYPVVPPIVRDTTT
jgi:hypothetical protein